MQRTKKTGSPLCSLPVPADYEEFELTINGDKVDPLMMVRQDGYSNWEQWEFRGPRVYGIQTRRFKLVRPGHCRDLAGVRRKAGKLTDGQWREAFRQKYPRPDGRDSIGFAGSEWVDSNGFFNFPYLCGGSVWWCSDFHWAPTGFHEGWRWLVEMGK